MAQATAPILDSTSAAYSQCSGMSAAGERIAAKLNERNVRTARGGVWTHVQVGAILHPFDGAKHRRRMTAKKARRSIAR